MWIRVAALAMCAGAVGGAMAGAYPVPDSIIEPTGDPDPPGAARPDYPRVPGDPDDGDVTVSSIGSIRKDAIGLVPARAMGLPRWLWSESDPERLNRLVADLPNQSLPAIQTLVTGVLLVEANPPADAARDGDFLLARVDKLMAMGAIDEAGALIEQVRTPDPATFARAFDIALLVGREDRACAALAAQPDARPSFAIRVFCLARAGEWNAAALTLESASALSEVSRDQDTLLALLLDPDLREELEAPRPTPVTPLDFFMLRAIEKPIPTTPLPLPFAHADIDGGSGWRAQITAAERLARAGAIDGERLLDIYRSRRPAASGGVWDRVAAVQSLLSALDGGDEAEVAEALPDAWRRLKSAGLGVAAAEAVAPEIRWLRLDGEARRAATEMIYLTTEAESAARAMDPANPKEALMRAIALGEAPATPPPGIIDRAVARAFAAPPAPADAATRSLLGEEILSISARFRRGRDTPPADLTSALRTLRELGLERAAREAALQLVILD